MVLFLPRVAQSCCTRKTAAAAAAVALRQPCHPLTAHGIARGRAQKTRVVRADFPLSDLRFSPDNADVRSLKSSVAGSTVLVRVLTGDAAANVSRYRSGMVSDAEDDGRSYDVIYDETDASGNGDGVRIGGPDEEEDEEDGVAAERVVTVSLSPCVSCAARLNLARCSFRSGGHAEVRPDERVDFVASPSASGTGGWGQSCSDCDGQATNLDQMKFSVMIIKARFAFAYTVCR